jgi:hypothetical protein
MTLALDMDALLASVNTVAEAITGIRAAYDYDEWPDSLPGMPAKDAAFHFTGFPEERDGWTYHAQPGLSWYDFDIPLYTVVVEAAKVRRSRQWAAPYVDRYRLAFDTRTNILAVGTGNTGSITYGGAQVVRSIPDWPGYDGFFILRHRLVARVKGAVDRG